MIRLFLLAAGFLSVTIALLVTQMGGEDDTGQPEVTRASNPVFDFAGDSVGEASSEQVARAVPLATQRVRAPTAEPLDQSAPISSQIDLMTRNILQELRQPVTGDRLRQVASSANGESDELRALTDGVLAGPGAPVAPTTTATDAGSPQSLNALIIQAMREGQSDAYVDALLNEAVGKGEVAAPPALVTPSGEVDTATLLDSLVQQSVAAQSAPSAPEPAPVIAAVPEPEGDLFYTVQPGDSLAGIALRHYGTTTAHEIIYMANRAQLPSPSAVSPGMKLRIPQL